MKRYAILVDGSNLYEAIKLLNMNFDYNKLLNYFEGDLVRAMYFTAVAEDKNVLMPIRPLLDHLEYNGYSMVSKFYKQYSDPESGAVTIKGNMDIEIAIQAINVAPFCTDIVLVTGDGDFCMLVDHLQTKYGVRVSCMSTRNPPMMSDDLRRKCDYFIDLADPQVREKLSRGLVERKFKFGG